VHAFEVVTINMPAKQKDNYSCGFWAANMMIQIVVEKRPLAEVSVNVFASEYRKVMTRFMKTRYLYIDGVFKDPNTHEEEKVLSVRKGDDILDDEKSEISALTTKTSGGKALNKHCPLCDFKLLTGPNCSRHCNTLHKGIKVTLVKCEVSCPHCSGKKF